MSNKEIPKKKPKCKNIDKCINVIKIQLQLVNHTYGAFIPNKGSAIITTTIIDHDSLLQAGLTRYVYYILWW